MLFINQTVASIKVEFGSDYPERQPKIKKHLSALRIILLWLFKICSNLMIYSQLQKLHQQATANLYENIIHNMHILYKVWHQQVMRQPFPYVKPSLISTYHRKDFLCGKKNIPCLLLRTLLSHILSNLLLGSWIWHSFSGTEYSFFSSSSHAALVTPEIKKLQIWMYFSF